MGAENVDFGQIVSKFPTTLRKLRFEIARPIRAETPVNFSKQIRNVYRNCAIRTFDE